METLLTVLGWTFIIVCGGVVAKFIDIVIHRQLNDRPVLFIPNYCGFFPQAPVGKVASKCIKLAWRCLFLLARKGDAIVVGKRIPDNFLAYFRQIKGFDPTIYHVTAKEPLDIVSTILADNKLCDQLRADAKGARWILTSLIQHPKMFELGKRLGLKVSGTPQHLVGQSLIQHLNSKTRFATWMEARGHEVAGKVCSNTSTIHEEAYMLFRAHHKSIIVRADISAGGLGNKVLMSLADVEAFIASLPPSKEHARAVAAEEVSYNPLHPRTYHAMVGPYLDLRHHVSVMLEVGNKGGKILTTCLRNLKGSVESIGGLIPAPNLPGMNEACAVAMEYAAHLSSLGYRGVADIDLAFDENGEGHVYFESNARLVLTCVPYQLYGLYARRWKLDKSLRHNPRAVQVLYDENPPLKEDGNFTLEELEKIANIAVEDAKDQGVIRDATIIIVSPPDPETGWYSVAYVLGRHDQQDAMTILHRCFHSCALDKRLYRAQTQHGGCASSGFPDPYFEG